MATTIDQKVVEMRFDNRDFEKNTRQTMSTLEKLKEKLHFKGASDGLEEISKAARKVDMNGLAEGIQTVSAKFSAMEVIGTTALVNITNSAVNAGKRLVSSISFDQIASGWNKMGQQMSSMQTLMNSTGKSIEEIEDYLNELMWYSDETSYSFTDMTAALANMTATGGKIEKLVPMIMGMANATAYAGKGAAEFSRVIYNLNQSYGGGYLTLMDWKSVKLAGANSKQLTESLIHWGEALGTIKKGQVSIANFDDTLKDKWVTTQVMEKAFGEFADFTLKVKEAVDSGEYDTASEAIDALAGNYEGISKQAFKAAQEAKSFTEAVDATKDAVSSKWMQVFKTIFGNYNEQRQLWTDLANSLWEIFAEPVEKLNSYLQKALGFTAIKEVWDKINNNPIMDAIKEVDGAIKKSSKSLEEYQAIVRKVWRGDFNNRGDNPDRFDLLSQAGWDPRVVQSLVNKTDEMAGYGKGWTVIDKLTIDDVTAAEQKYGIQVDKTTVSIKDQQKAQKALDKLTDDYLKNSCGLTETQIELYHDLVAASRKYGISIDEIVKKMEKTNGRQHLEQSWREIGLIIKETLGAIGKAVGEVFHFNPINLYLSLEKLHEKLVHIREVLIGKWIKKDGEEVLEYSKHYQNLVDTLKGFISILKLAGTIVGGGFKIALTIVNTILRTFGLTVLDVTGAIGNVVSELVAWIEENDFILKGIQWLVETLMGGLRKLWDWADAQWGVNEAVKAFIVILKGGKSGLKSWIEGLMAADDVGEYLLDTFGKIPEKINQLWKAFSKTKIGKVVLSWWEAIKQSDFGQAIASWFDGLKNLDFIQDLKDYFNSFDTGSIAKNIAIGLWEGIKKYGQIAINGIKNFGLWILEAFKNILGIHSPSTEFFNFGKNIVQGLYNGIASIIGLVYTLITTVGNKIIDIVKDLDFGSLFVGIVSAGAVVSVIKMAKALSILADGLSSINGVIYEFQGVLNTFRGVLKAFKVKIITAALKDVAISIAILVGSIVVLTMLDTGKVWASIGAIAALIALLGGLVAFAGKFGKKESLQFGKMALIILSIGVAMALMASAFKKISKIENISWQALTAFGLMIGALVAVAWTLSRSKKSLINFGASLAAIGVALILMANVVKKLGKMDKGVLKQGMISLGIFSGLMIALMASTKLITGSTNVAKIGGALMAVGITFQLMARTVKILGKMDKDQLKQGTKALALFETMIIGLMAATRLLTGSKNVDHIGKTLASVGVAILLMGVTTKLLGTMDKEALIKGIAGVSAFIALIIGLIYGIKKVGGKDINNINKTLIGVTACIAVMSLSAALLGMMSLGNLAKGIIAVGLITYFVTLLVKSTEKARNLGKSLIPLTVAIGLLALSVGLLSLISPERLLAPTIALGLLMLCFGLMIKMSKDIGGQKKMLVNLAAMTSVIAILSVIIAKLSALDPGSVLNTAISIGLLLTAMTASLFVLSKIKFNIKDLATGLLGLAAIVAMIFPLIGAIKLLSGIQNAVPTINALVFFMGALTLMLIGIAATGAIYAATGGIGLLGLVGLFSMIPFIFALLGALATMNHIDNAEKNIILLTSLMTVMVGLLVPLSILGPLAAIGVTALYALVALMPALLLFATGIGALVTYIPMLAEFMNSGMQILIQLAGGLGEMIGAFVNGALTTISTGLPEIGMNLSKFMINATPFLIGAKMVNNQTLKAAGILTATIIALTAANFINGVLSFISFGNNFSNMGTELSKFAVNAMPFMSTMATIPAAAMNGVKSLASAILTLTAANVLNGLASFFGGGSASLAEFGNQLPDLGTKLGEFVKNLGEFSDAQVNTVNCAGQAIVALAEAANKLPKTGGFWQKIFGEGSLTQFAADMPGVAEGVKGFVDKLGEFSDPQIKTAECACKVITAIANAADSIPKSDGLWQKIFGSKGLKDFAKDMPTVATGVAGFIDKLKGYENKANVANAAGEIIKGIASLSDVNFDKFPNDKIKTALTNVGDGVANFVGKLKNIADSDVTSSSNKMTVIVEAVKKLVTTINESFDDNTGTITTTVEGIAKKASSGFSSNSVISELKTQAKNFIQGFANGINSNSYIAEDAARQVAANALNASKKRLDEHSPSKETEQQGEYFGEGFVLGIKKYSTRIYNVSSEVGNEAKRGLSAAVAKISNLVESDMDSSPTIRPVLDLSEVSDGMGYLDSMFGNPSMQLAANLNSIKTGMNNKNQNGNSDVVSAIDKLGRNLGNSNGNTYNINGITYDNNSSVNQAIQDLIRAIEIERRV